jgi:hypothetical protein
VLLNGSSSYNRGVNSIPTTPLDGSNNGRPFSFVQAAQTLNNHSRPNSNLYANSIMNNDLNAQPGNYYGTLQQPTTNNSIPSGYHGQFATIGHGGLAYNFGAGHTGRPQIFHGKQESNVSTSEYRDNLAPLGMNLGNTMRFDNSPASQILMSMNRQHSTQSENAASNQNHVISNQLLAATHNRPNSLSVSLNSGLLSAQPNGINSQTLPNRRNRNGIHRNNSFQNMANGQMPLGMPGTNNPNNHPNQHQNLNQPTYSQTLRIRNSNNLRKVSAPSTYNSGQLSPTGGQKLAHVSTPSGSINGFNTDTLTRKNNAKPVATPMAPPTTTSIPSSHTNSGTNSRNISNQHRKASVTRTNSHDPTPNQALNHAQNQMNINLHSKHSDNESNSRNSSCSTNSSGINSANNASDGSNNNQHHRHLQLSNQNSNSSNYAANLAANLAR